jgi:hypothetical protein
MVGVIGNKEARLKQGLKVFKEQPSKKLKGRHYYAVRGRSFVVVCSGNDRCNIFSSD